jgi:hypothetical protein
MQRNNDNDILAQHCGQSCVQMVPQPLHSSSVFTIAALAQSQNNCNVRETAMSLTMLYNCCDIDD